MAPIPSRPGLLSSSRSHRPPPARDNGIVELEEVVHGDRSERGKLRFTGPQRAWFLHQIMTQAFDPMPAGEAREAALLTVHGRMVGYLEAVATEDAILCHFEPELRATLPDQIGRYVFATRVEIDDVTDEMGLVLLAGPEWRRVASDVAPTAPVQPTSALGVDAGYIWLERSGVGDLLDRLAGAARRVEEAELEAIRISNGAPRWGRDMNEKTLPQEARLEDVAIDFNKGCYVGQEAVAKIYFRGKVNRKLRSISADEPVRTGSEVTIDGAKVGTVTSSAGQRALAMLRYTVEPGAVVAIGDVEGKVVA
jgi:tRNA-modifying protein YgfZ